MHFDVKVEFPPMTVNIYAKASLGLFPTLNNYIHEATQPQFDYQASKMIILYNVSGWLNLWSAFSEGPTTHGLSGSRTCFVTFQCDHSFPCYLQPSCCLFQSDSSSLLGVIHLFNEFTTDSRDLLCWLHVYVQDATDSPLPPAFSLSELKLTFLSR